MAAGLFRRSVVLAALVATAACASGSDGGEPTGSGTDVVDADLGVARQVTDESSDIASTENDVGFVTPSFLDDPSLNPEGVINAAIVLQTGGDIEVAFADGAFTRDELDAARAALAAGSLDYLFD
ncbi:MAG: hypothetical protein AAGA37_00650 [Actinomycetota bacterium]